jgi:hypothetical protein
MHVDNPYCAHLYVVVLQSCRCTYEIWGGDLCRDRATANTEDAIMNAHQDNHSGKAMEVVLAHAQQQGAVFLPALPLIPTLQDIKGMSREARAQEAGTSTRRR